MKKPALLILLFLITVFCFAQTPTTVTIRVLAKDAKFIGTGMGGMNVVIKNSSNGEVMASGTIEGGTGNTSKIIADSIGRYQQKATPESADFTTQLTLTHPQKITVSVNGPLSLEPENRITATEEYWIIPDQDLSEEGLILEIDGFAITAKDPVKNEDGSYTLKMHSVMLCGCPITPGGFWNANKMKGTALIYKNGELLKKVDMEPGKEKNTFIGNWKPDQKGFYNIYYSLFDPRNNNTGVDEVSLTVD
ncbi:hypothetical protein OO013_12370 [Mangrovivirga sp. M17]|uniref:Uncharacterized protein n=1 Tax=Mangrovivirga halotolerans TaxID=2993936 RepID=A0ABT3RSA0_9BACT|nr:hypothetical protein [Mangrovivirga halotolerans]MCX2744668.1 hypothetical protein [Mangrovivirga halotolerans]